jgi:hypothetical protein
MTTKTRGLPLPHLPLYHVPFYMFIIYISYLLKIKYSFIHLNNLIVMKRAPAATSAWGMKGQVRACTALGAGALVVPRAWGCRARATQAGGAAREEVSHEDVVRREFAAQAGKDYDNQVRLVHTSSSTSSRTSNTGGVVLCAASKQRAYAGVDRGQPARGRSSPSQPSRA